MERVSELTCIRCPLGCALTVTEHEGGEVTVTGNTCRRGEEYGRKEVTNPTRVVTTSVPVVGSVTERMLSVKCAEDVPKDKVRDVMAALKGVVAHAPVSIGDVIVADVAGTGVDIVATKCA